MRRCARRDFSERQKDCYKQSKHPFYDYYEANRSFYERIEVTVRSKLGEATFERAVVEGRTMDFDQAVEYAVEDEEASPK